MGGIVSMCFINSDEKISLRLEEFTERGEVNGEDGFWRKMIDSVIKVWKGEFTWRYPGRSILIQEIKN